MARRSRDALVGDGLPERRDCKRLGTFRQPQPNEAVDAQAATVFAARGCVAAPFLRRLMASPIRFRYQGASGGLDIRRAAFALTRGEGVGI